MEVAVVVAARDPDRGDRVDPEEKEAVIAAA
jgi:hypothetical protein